VILDRLLIFHASSLRIARGLNSNAADHVFDQVVVAPAALDLNLPREHSTF
jgi:hypothetical protein